MINSIHRKVVETLCRCHTLIHSVNIYTDSILSSVSSRTGSKKIA